MEYNQILSINKLASILGVKREVLETIASRQSKNYRPFLQKETKADGRIKHRKIDNPSCSIKSIQTLINKRILDPKAMRLPHYMTGSIKQRGTKKNAKPHVGKDVVLNIDLKDCYPSINSKSVYSLYKSNFGCSPPVAKLLTRLTTFGDRLPQGAPTSASLCNLVLETLTTELYELSFRNGVQLTQYLDDYTFSGDRKDIEKVQPFAEKLIEDHGFKINKAKTTFSPKYSRQSATGYVVNSKLSVGRKYIRKLQRTIINEGSEQSIKGKISHVQSVSKKKAAKLRSKLVASKK